MGSARRHEGGAEAATAGAVEGEAGWEQGGGRRVDQGRVAGGVRTAHPAFSLLSNLLCSSDRRCGPEMIVVSEVGWAGVLVGCTPVEEDRTVVQSMTITESTTRE